MEISELIKEAKHGSTAAQKCLFDELADKLLMICRRYVKNPEDAEEIMLDGFYKFFKNLNGRFIVTMEICGERKTAPNMEILLQGRYRITIYHFRRSLPG